LTIAVPDTQRHEKGTFGPSPATDKSAAFAPMGVASLTMLASILLTVGAVAFITIANWPRGRTPRRPLGNTMELAPFERL
jgi:hypothetical protein